MSSTRWTSALRILLGVVMVLMVAAFTLLLTVRITPIPLRPLAVIFQATLSNLLEGSVKVDGAKLVWAENEGRLMVVVDRVNIVDRDGATIDAKTISVGVSAQAFWDEGRLAVSHIDISEVALSPSKYAGLPGAATTFFRRRGGHARSEAGPRFDHFDLFAVRQIRFGGAYEEAENEPPSGMLLIREGQTLKGSANIAYRRNGKNVSLTAVASLTPGEDGELDVAFEHINPRDIGLFSRFLSPLQSLQLPLSGDLHVNFNAEVQPVDGSFNLFVEPGMLLLSEAVVPIDELTLGLDADFTNERARLRDGRFNIAGVAGAVTGDLEFALSGGLLKSFGITLDGQGMVINRPDIFKTKLDISRAQADITFNVAESLLEIDRLTLQHSYGQAETTGQIWLANNQPVFDFVTGFGAMPREAVSQLWPTPVAIKTRDWVDANIVGGTVTNATLALRASLDELVVRKRGEPMREGALQLDLDMDQVEIRFLSHLPPLRNTTASLSLRGTSFRAKTQGGEIDLPTTEAEKARGLHSRPVKVARTSILLPDFRAQGAPAEITFEGEAIIADMMRALALPPLNIGKTVNFDFDRIQGAATAKAKLQLPLIVPKGTRRQVDFEVDAVARDFAVNGALGAFTLDKGDAHMTLSNDGLDMVGRAMANGADVNFAWHQPFAPEKADSARLAVTGDLSPQNIADLGQGWLGVRLIGDTRVNVLINGPIALANGYRVHADLTEAKFFPRPLAYDKPVGTPSYIAAAISNKDGKIDKLRARFHVDGDDVLATQMKFVDGVVREAQMTPITVGKSKNITLSIESVEDSSFVSVMADVFDAEQLFDKANKDLVLPDTPFSFLPFLGPNVVIEGRIGEVVGAHEASIDATRFRLVRQDGMHEEAWLEGVFADGTDLLFSIERNNPRWRNFSLQTENAGNVLRLFDWVEEFYGGALTVQGKMYDTGFAGSGKRRDVEGRLTLVSFRARNVGVLAQILTLASLTGIADTLGGDGIKFNKAKGNFSITDGIMKISEAQINGPAVGLTAQGDFDMVTGDVDIGGTLVPAYALNSFLGKIPLVGRIFASREGEGLIGIGYRVAGERGDVGVLVNPLSVLTPGVFRRVFEIGIGLPDRDPDPSPDVTADPKGGPDSALE